MNELEKQKERLKQTISRLEQKAMGQKDWTMAGEVSRQGEKERERKKEREKERERKKEKETERERKTQRQPTKENTTHKHTNT